MVTILLDAARTMREDAALPGLAPVSARALLRAAAEQERLAEIMQQAAEAADMD